MKAFIVVSCLVLAASAKPQGYVYNPPGTGISLTLLPPASSHQSFSGGPSFSHGLPPASGSLGLGSHSSGGSLSLGSSYSVGGGSGSSFGGSFGNGNSFGSGSSFGNSNPLNSLASFLTGSGQVPSFAPAPAFAPSAQSNFVPSQPAPAPAQAQSTLVQKHIYVHVPPPEEEEFNLPILPQSIRQKHYKIIFIKAPSGPSISQQIAQAQLVQQQNEEKTLVYVLVKKPESLEEIQQNLARQPQFPQQPSKPEVYFIKYKAQTGFSQPIPIPGGQVSPSELGLTGPDFSQGGADAAGSNLSGQSLAALTGGLGSSSGSSPAESSSSNGSSGGDIANEVIQPRVPAAEYGPPKK